MQYVLTEDEYKGLAQVKALLTLNESEKLQDLCTLAANRIPVEVDWMEGDPRPWGCILNSDPDQNPGYCDHCPAEEVCPHEWKRWSK